MVQSWFPTISLEPSIGFPTSKSTKLYDHICVGPGRKAPVPLLHFISRQGMHSRLFSIGLSGLMTTALLSGPLQAADLGAGRTKVKSTCQVCHGLDGIGKLPDVPNLAGEGTIYLIKQLEAFRSGQRTHQQMSIIAKDLSDEEIANVATYYSAIKVTVELPE